MSVMVINAVRPPLAVGVKATLIVQFAPAVTTVPQVFVCAKSAAPAPVTPRLAIFSGALPVFVRATVWGPLVVPTD